MKIRSLLLGAFASSLMGANIVLAAWTVDHFTLEVNKDTTKIGEAIDLTVKAVDKDNNVVSNYMGSILIFSESDTNAEFPGTTIKDNTYKFTAADQWKVKFENAIKFSMNGKQDISVYDSENDTILGKTEVTVGWTSAGTTTWSEEIKISSPENWTTVWTDSIKVSWTTIKNHKVKVTLNGSKTFDTTSNDSGTFEIQITDIESGDSVLKAMVLDADGKTIWESTEVKISSQSNAPKMNSIAISPEWELDAETEISVEVLATKGLKEVEAVINDTVTKLEETSDGKYTGKINAPTEAWVYAIDINLTDDLGHKTENKAAKSITVKAMNAASTWALSVWTGMVLDTVKNLKLVKMKTKSILTWDKVENAVSYNVYKKDPTTWEMKLITNVTEPRYEVEITWDKVTYEDFAIKAFGKDWDKEIESADYSEMTKVQTGPTEIFLAILAVLLAAGFVYFKRRRQA